VDECKSLQDGRIMFSANWMDKYGTFFDEFKTWFAEINNLRVRVTGHVTAPLLGDTRFMDQQQLFDGGVDAQPLTAHGRGLRSFTLELNLSNSRTHS
jgi:hypothetical protein